MKAKASEQIATGTVYGVVTGPGSVRIERVLPGPIERVWAYLTESEKRGKWFASGPMELKPEGNVELHFKHSSLSPITEPTPEKFKQYESGDVSYGRVMRSEPPHLLTFRWKEAADDESEVTFELSEQGEHVLLVLTHTRLRDRRAMVSVSGGWHAHLDVLVDHLNGHTPKPFWSTYERLDSEYDQRIDNSVKGTTE
jgi:uncharacterized protein YndB with AHSA1/START domain